MSALALTPLGSLPSAAPARAADSRPNVVVFMTDDQDATSLRVMSKVKALLGDEGTTFERNFASYPLCCPSRSTFLTGQYAHNHGVLSNHAPAGGYFKLDHSNTLPVWLQDAGYYTVEVGKYLNEYARAYTEIPPGWNEWYAVRDEEYVGFQANENGRLLTYPRDPAYYETDVHARKAVDVVQRLAPSDRPFFLYLAFGAVHYGGPADPDDPTEIPTPSPAPKYRDAFAGEPLPADPSINEADVSDKPASIRARPALTDAQLAGIRENYQQTLETLLSVDDAVADVVEALRVSGELDNTLIVFTSDNGYFYGQHRIPWGKTLVYDAAARVPLVVRGPGFPRGVRSQSLVANVDLAPTIAELAGARPGRPQDGRSLLETLREPDVAASRELLHEAPALGVHAVRTSRFVYSQLSSGERELYDLDRDPYELDNRAAAPAYADEVARLSERLARLRTCSGKICLGCFGAVPTLYGTSAPDHLTGTAARDVVAGLAGDDVIEGLDGDDLVCGGPGSDTIDYSSATGRVEVDLSAGQGEGSAGRDRLDEVENVVGSATADSLAGDDGTDALAGGPGDDTLDGGAGSDRIDYSASAGPVVVDLAAGAATGDGTDALVGIEEAAGSAYSDTLAGDDGPNVLVGQAGADGIDGRGGDDRVDYSGSAAPVTLDLASGTAAGDGADALTGIELVTGSRYGDTLRGDGGANTLWGEAGADTLAGGGGDDVLDGGSGIDRADYGGAPGAVEVDLSGGSASGDGADTLTAVEQLSGSAYSDSLTGDAGANVLSGGPGDDRLDGAGGGDRADYSASAEAVTVDLATGTAFGDGADSLQRVENVRGSRLGDILAGDGDANELDGGPGADIVTARGGADRALGGEGDDTLRGGAGDDSLEGGPGFDRVSYAESPSAVKVDAGAGLAKGEGTDALLQDEAFAGSPFGDLMTGGTGADALAGGAGNDRLDGRAGDDAVEGNEGADTVAGGLGNDRLDGGAGRDRVDYATSKAGIDLDLAGGTAAGQGADSLDGFEDVAGSAAADTLRGGAGANTLTGGAGADTLSGREGDDTLLGGAGNDALGGGDGIDSVDYTSAAGPMKVDLPAGTATGQGTDTLAAVERVTGSKYDDVLAGSEGRDLLNGGAGADAIAGGPGGDRLQGQAGDDELRGQDGDDYVNGGAGYDACSQGPGKGSVVYCEANLAAAFRAVARVF